MFGPGKTLTVRYGTEVFDVVASGSSDSDRLK